MILAFILIIIGAVFFLKNAGLIAVSWNVIWPLIVIGIGIYVAVVSRRVAGWWNRIWDKISKKLE